MRARTRRRPIGPFRVIPICLALFFATELSCSAASAAIPAPVAKLAGCYHVTLARSAPAATDAAGNALHRTVEFFAELATAKVEDAADSYVVRENRSSGYRRLFERARWHVEKNQSMIVVFSDGAEEWSATLKSASHLSGTATYSGDIEHPERHWSAAASRYACRR